MDLITDAESGHVVKDTLVLQVEVLDCQPCNSEYGTGAGFEGATDDEDGSATDDGDSLSDGSEYQNSRLPPTLSVPCTRLALPCPFRHPLHETFYVQCYMPACLCRHLCLTLMLARMCGVRVCVVLAKVLLFCQYGGGGVAMPGACVGHEAWLFPFGYRFGYH